MSEARVTCRTPTPGKSGVTQIPVWKFDLIRGAILDELAAGEVAFADLKDRIRGRIPADTLSRLGALGWHLTSAKLELEIRGEITRKPVPERQILELKD